MNDNVSKTIVIITSIILGLTLGLIGGTQIAKPKTRCTNYNLEILLDNDDGSKHWFQINKKCTIKGFAINRGIKQIRP